jgi:misacylated tRNA(Ala) deacylase
MRELHTDLHIVNALVYQGFNGALVTGVQMNNDGTARIDFDL